MIMVLHGFQVSNKAFFNREILLLPVIVPSDILKFYPEPFLAILILHILQSSGSF